MIGFSFHEVMEGTAQRPGERFDRPFRFEFHVVAPSVLGFATSAVGEAIGHVRVDGLAKNAEARGTLELSPIQKQIVRYAFDFVADDGKKYRFVGTKKVTPRRHLVGWTTLPGEIRDEHGELWATAVLRFSLRKHLRGLVSSIRLSGDAERLRVGHV